MSGTYLVTGANRGVGLEFAAQLAERGDDVIATCRRPGDGCRCKRPAARRPRLRSAGPLLRRQRDGATTVTESFLPQLRAGERRLVANMTSRMGSIEDNTSGGSYAYRASKAALNIITRSLAIDLRAERMICVVLHPGWVRTDMGGGAAPLSVQESVAGLLRLMGSLSLADSGRFLDHSGHEVPW